MKVQLVLIYDPYARPHLKFPKISVNQIWRNKSTVVLYQIDMVLVSPIRHILEERVTYYRNTQFVLINPDIIVNNYFWGFGVPTYGATEDTNMF